ncbi:hypothetical protein BU17DRAFT_63095 [Hysterangium stoloniferum]|nr:hypothetical protein BU17DRAFT_63095 [Hysterangium stoloniferum]
MNSFRSVLALLSIMGLVSAAPQGAESNGVACFLGFPGCMQSLANNPSIPVDCQLAGGIDFMEDAECYQAFIAAGLISPACKPCASLFNPPGPPTPFPAAPVPAWMPLYSLA